MVCHVWSSCIIVLHVQSGAILAVIAAMCVQYPDAQLAIVFLPFFTFSAGMVPSPNLFRFASVSKCHLARKICFIYKKRNCGVLAA